MPSGQGRGVLRKVKVAGGKSAWQGDWTDARGRRRRVVLGDTKADAERNLAARIRDRDLELAGMGVERGLSMSVHEIAEQYIAALRTRSKPSARVKALDMARRTFDQLERDVRPRTVRDLTKPAMLAWRNALVAAGAANKTANGKVALVSAALNLAKEMGQLQANPLSGLKGLPTGPSHQRRRPRALSDWEVGRVLAAALQSDRENPLQFPREPLLRAFLVTGTRWAELVQVTYADLDVSEGTLRLRAETTKGGKERRIPLAPETVTMLLGLADAAERVTGKRPQSSSRIFLTPSGRPWLSYHGDPFRDWLCKCYERVGILQPGKRTDADGFALGIHTCRHSWIHRARRAGWPAPLIRFISGHSADRVMDESYVHFQLSDARSAILSLQPFPSVCMLPAATEGRPAASASPGA